MARINVEDCWWTDPRRAALQRLGLDADGIAVRAWMLAQDFWKHEHSLIPKQLFDALEGAQALLQVGLAEAGDQGVYVRGSSAYLEWVIEKQKVGKENGAKGGKASAAARRKKYGTAAPVNGRNNRSQTEPNTEPNRSQSNPSVSASVSGSNTKNTNTGRTRVRHAYTPDFEEVWKLYGNTAKKADAFSAFEKQGLTPEDIPKLRQAIRNYLADCRAKNRILMNFSTFLNQDWEPWVEIKSRRPQLKTVDDLPGLAS